MRDPERVMHLEAAADRLAGGPLGLVVVCSCTRRYHLRCSCEGCSRCRTAANEAPRGPNGFVAVALVWNGRAWVSADDAELRR